MISDYKVHIIIILYDYKDWVTTELLANRLNIKKRTVQYELAGLMESYKKEIIIESNKKYGYRLISISENIKQYIIELLTSKELNYRFAEKTSLIALFILFEKDGTSINRIANELYLSTTSVYNEIATLKRWINRINGIEMQVTGKGITVYGNEYFRRATCSIFGRPDFLTLMPEFKNFNIEINIKQIYDIIRNNLIEEKIYLSGQDFNLFVKFIYFSYVRNKMGFGVENNNYNFDDSFLKNKDLALRIIKNLDLEFKDKDINYIAEYLLGYTSFDVNSIATANIRLKIGEFDKYLSKLFDVNFTILENIDSVERHTVNMIKRIQNHKRPVNYIDKKIVQTLPLESHLSEYFCTEVINVNPPKAEILFLALYLGSSMSKLKKYMRILLISNQNISVVNNLTAELTSIMGNYNEIEYLPYYMWSEEGQKKYDLYLTTEAQLIFNDQSFKLIPPIINDFNSNEIKAHLVAHITKNYENKKNYIKKNNFIYHNMDSFDDSTMLIADKKAYTTENFIDKKTLVQISTCKEFRNSVNVYILKKHLRYKLHDIDQIIVVKSNYMINETFIMFEILSEYLLTQKAE